MKYFSCTNKARLGESCNAILSHRFFKKIIITCLQWLFLIAVSLVVAQKVRGLNRHEACLKVWKMYYSWFACINNMGPAVLVVFFLHCLSGENIGELLHYISSQRLVCDGLKIHSTLTAQLFVTMSLIWLTGLLTAIKITLKTLNGFPWNWINANHDTEIPATWYQKQSLHWEKIDKYFETETRVISTGTGLSTLSFQQAMLSITCIKWHMNHSDKTLAVKVINIKYLIWLLITGWWSGIYLFPWAL